MQTLSTSYHMAPDAAKRSVTVHIRAPKDTVLAGCQATHALPGIDDCSSLLDGI
jgi:hypothetical protein